MPNRWLLIVLGILIAGLSFTAGLLLKDFPSVKLDTNVNLGDIANVFATLGASIIIPFVLAKLIDNSRSQKNQIVDDLNRLLTEAKKIKDRVSTCYSVGTINRTDKLLLTADSEYVYGVLYNITIYLNDYFGKTGQISQSEINNTFTHFWDEIAGGPLMGSNYTTVDQALHDNQAQKYLSFEQAVRKAMYDIHRL